MIQGLFRREVLAARYGEQLGSIQLQPPRIGWVYFGLSLMVIGGALILITTASYTRHQVVQGSLVPDGGVLNVAAPSAGLIVKLLVSEGESVTAGQALLEISGERDSASLGSTRNAILLQLHAKRNRLESEISEARQIADLKQQEYTNQKRISNDQIKQIVDQIALQKERVDSSNALYEQWLTLKASGLVTKLQLLQQHDSALQNEVQLKELRRQEIDARQQLSQRESDQRQSPFNLEKQINELSRQIADIDQDISESEMQRATVLKAPADGAVANLMAHVGQTVTTQQALLNVISQNTRLQAELWVPSRAVGFLANGNRVTLHYQAFPYQKFGEHWGTIAAVSRSAVAPSELGRVLGKEIRESRYRVLVNLDVQDIFAYGKAEPLKSGLDLDADLLLDRRRLIEWIFEPMLGMAKTWHGAPSVEGKSDE